ncbi:T9SS type A sorting domain-containing protein [Flavitalea antarctica]
MNYSVSPKLKTAGSTSCTAAFFRIIFSITFSILLLQPSIGQPLGIKSEFSFGGSGQNWGPFRTIRGDGNNYYTLYTHFSNMDGFVRWRISKFSPNMELLNSFEIPSATRQNTNTAAAFIQTPDLGFVSAGFISVSRANGRSDFDIRIVKSLPGGTTSWEKIIGGTGDDRAIGIQQEPNGDLLILCNADSPDGDILNASGQLQVILTRLDRNGNFISKKIITNTGRNEATAFMKTADGNYVISGASTNEIRPPYLAEKGLLIKMAGDGTIKWQSSMNTTSQPHRFNNLAEDKDGNLIIAGKIFRDTSTISDALICRFGQNGNFISHQSIGGTAADEFKSLAITPTGIIVAGGSTYSRDGDISDNVYGHVLLVTSIHPDGRFYNSYLGHESYNIGTVENIINTHDNKIYLITQSNFNNVFKKTRIGVTDGWLVQLGMRNTVFANAYIDANQNGIQDTGEKNFNYGKLQIQKSSAQAPIENNYAFRNRFEAILDTGDYVLTFLPDLPHYTVTQPPSRFSFTTYNNIDSIKIALRPDVSRADLELSLASLSFARPGFDMQYILKYKSLGTTITSNTTITYIKDRRVQILSTSPAASVVRGDTLTWNMGALNPMDSGYISLMTRLNAPPAVANGDTIISKADINHSVKDESPGNNTVLLKQVARGAYDPNDKMEFHGGKYAATGITGEGMIYRIRFQNTGTDTAFNVVIRDTLHENLDWNSLRMIDASHPYRLLTKNGKHLEWKFSNIFLPDSNTNEKASHGYILFSIRPKSTLKPGDQISNRASIYFDFNPPIITNTATTILADMPPLNLPNPELTGLQSPYCGNLGIQSLQIANHGSVPGATIVVTIDDKPVAVGANGRFSFNVSGLIAGLHAIKVKFVLNASASELNQQFIVTAALTPIVKITSTSTAVDESYRPILLSANNAAAGGSAATFTFALNSKFDPAFRVENNINTATLFSTQLKAGENWVYVRMRSSETCTSSQTAIDSIKITKLTVTVITDPDNPASVIRTYPNPASNYFIIEGVQTGGRYSLQVFDATGRPVKMQTLEGQSSYRISLLNITPGNLFIRLFDLRKKRLLGSSVLIR